MRWSAPALLVVAGALWVEALLGGTLVGNPLALLVMAGLALVVGLRTPWSVVVAVGLVASLLLAVGDQVGAAGRFSLGNDGVFYAVVVLGPAVLGLAVAARNRHVARLEERRAELASRRRTVLLAARADEAARVTAQVDAALATSLSAIVEAAHDPARLDVVEDTSRSALNELRDLLGVLHDPGDVPVVTPPSAPARRPLDAFDAVLALAGIPLAVETAHAGPVPADVVLSLLQGALLPIARRRPVLGPVVVLGVACVQTSLLAPLPPTVSWLLPGLLLAVLVGATPGRTAAVVGLVVTVAGVGLMSEVTPAGHRAGGLLPGLVLGVLAWCGGRVLAGREARARELRAIADELLRTEATAARLAGVEQRAELARELHDVGAHALTVAVLQAGAARTWADRDPVRAEQARAALRELADGPLSALGRSLPALTDRPLLAVVGDLGRVLGLRVEVVEVGGPRPVPEPVTAAVVRVVQEALTNAARHAPGSSVVVRVVHEATALRVSVHDSGPTAKTPTVVGSGRGLVGLRERVAALGGELVAGPDDEGFAVLATLPA